jgi:hypothetical protein
MRTTQLRVEHEAGLKPQVCGLVTLAVLLLLIPDFALAKSPADNLLGIRLDMPIDDVAKRLEKIGRLDTNKEGPGGAKQFWELRDRRYSWLAVRFNDEKKVVWVTVFARQEKDGRTVRYRDIGKLDEARHHGQYLYTWTVKKKGKPGSYAVTARGTDPALLSSLSLYNAPGDS